MYMSKDRILMFPNGPGARFCSPDLGQEFIAGRTAMKQAFRLDAEQAQQLWCGGWGIVCRPSQFARFVILREAAGGQNAMKKMESGLFLNQEDAIQYGLYRQGWCDDAIVLNVSNLAPSSMGMSHIYDTPERRKAKDVMHGSGRKVCWVWDSRPAKAYSCYVPPPRLNAETVDAPRYLNPGDVFTLKGGISLRITKKIKLEGKAAEEWDSMNPEYQGKDQ